MAFCDLLGYSPSKVLGWLHGEYLPEEQEVLSIAGTLGIDVYKVLDRPKPEPELLKLYYQFSHLQGQDRSRLVLAIFEVERLLKEGNISTSSPEATEIMKNVFEKYGLNK